MNELAQELNETLRGTIIAALLSEMGRRFYFPKGIVAQTSEAKKLAHRYDATVGMAFEEGEPLHLPAIRDYMPELSPQEIFAYSTTSGEQALRDVWHEEMLRKNPDLEGKSTSVPLVVSGITHGLATTADLLVDAGDVVVLPDMFWGNYRLIFSERRGARIATFPFFDDKGGFNLGGLRDVLRQEARDGSPDGSAKRKIIVLLNFPNNPTGYSPSEPEKNDIVQILTEAAESGAKIAVITVVILLIAFTYLPPYSVVSCQWCLSRDGKTIVKGYIVNSIYRNPAPGVAIQIKLFPSGSAIPLHDRQFGSTDVNGVFSVELGPSPPEQQEMYIINTAYNYSSLFLTDRWHIKDFSRANPGQCK